MENATKALLIAAAVLVAIIIISLTLAIVRQGQEAIAGADMTEAQIEAFNAKFKTYEGSNVSTTQVKALLNAVLSNNLAETNAGTNRHISITGGKVTQETSATSVTTISGTDYYTVKCTYNTNGLITSIDIQ